jgi:nitrous oxidase accessory protein
MGSRRRPGAGRFGRTAATLAAVLLLPSAAPPVVLAQEMAPVLPGALEGRPPARDLSRLQARVDAAAPGATVEVEAGTYAGDLILDKPLRLVGRGRPRLVGSGQGSVVRVRADRVTIEGFTIDGRRGGDLSLDSSGVHSAARDTTLRDLEIVESLFGVYLREANGAVVERCRVRGIPGKDPGEKGSGIHAYNLEGFRFDDNEVVDVRDGLYLQNASKGTLSRNVARDVRYGLHYMFSDDNVFEDNTFENGAAGTAIMYSERLVFRRNRFLRNRGFASVGLLFQSCDDVLAEENLVADNARGVFVEGSHRITLRRNVIAGSDVAIVLYDPDGGHRFEGNSFVGNMTPLDLVARQTDTVFLGNYWSGNEEPDLDGDGRSDRPYRLTSVFDHFRGNLTAADLLSDSFAAVAIGAAERAFPVLRLVPVEDVSPLARPPLLPGVPRPDARATGPRVGGIAASLALGLVGAIVLVRGRRPSTGSRPGNKMEPAAP